MTDPTAAPDFDNPKPDFIAELTPHRSLGRTGFIVLMVFVSFTCFVSGMMFLIMGAWPVFLFMALDVFIIWLAFKINYHSAKARELVTIGHRELRIQKIDPAGRMVEHVFNPYWSRFEVDRHEEYGITAMWIKCRDEELSIGSFLNPTDRESFALAFGHAIRQAKG